MPKYLVLILISAFILGIYDLFKKASVKENAVLPVLFFSNVAGMLFFMLLTALQGKFVEYACGIESTWHFFLIFVKACIVASSWGLCFYAMRELPISIASPIRATAPFWTFIGSLIWFREFPSLLQGLAMLIIFVGYYMFTVISKMEGINFKRNKGFHSIILGTLVGSLAALFDKYLMGVENVPKSTVQFYFTVDLVFIFGMAYLVRCLLFKDSRKFEWRWSIAVTGILLIVADYVYFSAVSIPGVQIAILSLLRRSSCIVTFLIGYKYFKDVNFKVKLFALLLFLAGIVMLALA